MPNQTNESLAAAKRNKNDEFYTRIEDVEAELKNYIQYFKDKIIYLPCDDTTSSFWLYFKENFNTIQPKYVIATCKDLPFGNCYILSKNGIVSSKLKDSGDFFSSDEYIDTLKLCDVVITNPPFSIFRPFLSQIFKYDKKFLIIGNQNAFAYKEVFPYLKSGEIRTGYNMVKKFIQPDGSTKQFGNICWFTNLPTTKSEKPLELKKEYNPTLYPKYDNYNAINVDRAVDIPKDYNGIMGVPITFLDKICLSQFKIIGVSASWDETPEMKEIKTSPKKRHGPFINGKEKYKRLFIKPLTK